jgi:long-chain acyl-CoA synthetase
MKFGATNLLITNPRDMPGFVKELKYRFTAITGVNTLFNALLNTPGSPGRLLAPASDAGRRHGRAAAVAEKWKQVTGVPLVEAYGLTETSPAAPSTRSTCTEFNGSIGLPISSTDICIKDDDGNEPADRRVGRAVHPRPAGDEGLLATPGETAKVFTPTASAHRRHGAWTSRASSASSTARRT